MIWKNIYYILLLETVDNEIQLIFEAIYSQRRTKDGSTVEKKNCHVEKI